MLQLTVSQQISNTAYTFKGTGIRVYSIEEALYHVYHHWRESAEDFSSAKLISWVDSLGHPRLADKIAGIVGLTSFSRRMVAFLGIIDYFSPEEIAALKADLESWEHRVEWERLKDQADHLVTKGEPARALPLYRRALKYDQNVSLLNNMAVACMKLGNHAEAVSLLAKAYASQPSDTKLCLHYAEAAILNGDYDTGIGLLMPVKSTPEAMFLQGLAAYRQEDYPAALSLFTKAADTVGLYNRCIHKIADTYMQMRQYDKALASLDASIPDYHVKAAEIYAAQGHAYMPQAIDHIRQALKLPGLPGQGPTPDQTPDQTVPLTQTGHTHTGHPSTATNQDEAALWTTLARHYRNDYDIQRASEAIANALPSENPLTLLENARINKSKGRMRDYRSGLSDVLKLVKEQYRNQEGL